MNAGVIEPAARDDYRICTKDWSVQSFPTPPLQKFSAKDRYV